MSAGVDIARVRDVGRIFADAQILNSKWRLLSKNKLRLELRGSRGFVNGRYLESRETSHSGKPTLTYRFAFPEDTMGDLRPLLDGMVNASVLSRIGGAGSFGPKFLLVALAPDLFRKEGWPGLIAKLYPGHELVKVGLNQVAIRPFVSSGESPGE